MWLQHDGAPPHFGREVKELVNKNYKGTGTGPISHLTLPITFLSVGLLEFESIMLVNQGEGIT